MSATVRSCIAVSVPSRRAPSRTVIRIGCLVVAAVNCSSRVNSSCTGRPSRSTASATTSSVSISCLPPNPPPTRAVSTRTWLRSSPNSPHSASRVRNGVCELVRSTSRPPSIQPIVAWVSRCTCCTRCTRNVCSYVVSAAAKPAARSPVPP